MTNPALFPARLDAEATVLLAAAKNVTGAILARREDLDRQGRARETLVVLAGEMHYLPVHHIHHLAVLDRLRKKERVAVAIEGPHNFLEKQFFLETGRKPDAAQTARLRKADADGGLSLKTVRARVTVPGSNHTRRILHEFLLRARIPARFVDAAGEGWELDSTDPSTAASLRACPAEGEPSWLDIAHARNHHMDALAASFADAARARILVVLCGNAHIAGRTDVGDPARNSLSARFRARGSPMLAVPLFAPSRGNGPEHMPTDHGLAPSELLPVADLSVTRSYYDAESNKPYPGYDTDLSNQAEEAAYANGLLHRCDLGRFRIRRNAQTVASHASAVRATIARCK